MEIFKFFHQYYNCCFDSMQKKCPIYFSGFMDVGIRDLNFLFDSANDSTFDDILPIYIESNFTVKKHNWDDFCGDIPIESPFNAHTFWNIQYTYELTSELIPTTSDQNREKLS